MSTKRMMPLMKLATIFCRPKPMPTPAAPENTVSAERLMPTAPSAIAIANTIKPIRITLTSSTCTDGVRSPERAIWLSAKLLATLEKPQAPPARHHRELDQQQRRQPQAPEGDRHRVEQIDGRIELPDDAFSAATSQSGYRHHPQHEGIADHRGQAGGWRARPAPAWRTPRADSCDSARSTPS